jgi:hypothetical protein
LIKLKNILFEEESRKLRIFDFDDTLVKSNSRVKVTDKNGNERWLSAGEYAVYTQKPEDNMDFSEFKKVIDPKEIKAVTKILRNFYKANGNRTITILTARGVVQPIQDFMRDIGIERINIVAVDSSDPNSTFQWQTDIGVGFQNLNSVGQYSGTTNDTLIVANITLSNNNQPFRCIINSGFCSDTSNVALLTVNNNVGINEYMQDNLFSVFPNPAQTVINVKADSKLIGELYTIIDNTGRAVLSGKIAYENMSIELGSLSNGFYVFQVKDKINQSFRIIKN